jgi:hypothetical protein
LESTIRKPHPTEAKVTAQVKAFNTTDIEAKVAILNSCVHFWHCYDDGMPLLFFQSGLNISGRVNYTAYVDYVISACSHIHCIDAVSNRRQARIPSQKLEVLDCVARV